MATALATTALRRLAIAQHLGAPRLAGRAWLRPPPAPTPPVHRRPFTVAESAPRVKETHDDSEEHRAPATTAGEPGTSPPSAPARVRRNRRTGRKNWRGVYCALHNPTAPRSLAQIVALQRSKHTEKSVAFIEALLRPHVRAIVRACAQSPYDLFIQLDDSGSGATDMFYAIQIKTLTVQRGRHARLSLENARSSPILDPRLLIVGLRFVDTETETDSGSVSEKANADMQIIVMQRRDVKTGVRHVHVTLGNSDHGNQSHHYSHLLHSDTTAALQQMLTLLPQSVPIPRAQLHDELSPSIRDHFKTVMHVASMLQSQYGADIQFRENEICDFLSDGKRIKIRSTNQHFSSAVVTVKKACCQQPNQQNKRLLTVDDLDLLAVRFKDENGDDGWLVAKAEELVAHGLVTPETTMPAKIRGVSVKRLLSIVQRTGRPVADWSLLCSKER